MNKQESFDFNQTHQANVKLVESVAQILVLQWQRDGKPKEPSETSKRMNIIVSGALDRIDRGEDAPHSKVGKK
jgi:hypothetical protein